MIQFSDFIKQDLCEAITAVDVQKRTKFLVQSIYTQYADFYSKDTPESVGWMDGSENALARNTTIYEAGIKDKDSVLDVGCGVAHFYYFLENQGWNGKYLGIDPNKKAIDLIDENINTMCGTIDGLPDFMKYDWVIASGVFNLGLKEDHSKWIIEKMIKSAKKGIVFNMLRAPYDHDEYEAYYPNKIKEWLEKFDHNKIEIMEHYMTDDTEFTVYFYV